MTIATKPSEIAIPSAPASNVRHRPRPDRARVLANAMKSNGLMNASTPATITMSDVPVSSSRTPVMTAAKEDPQAASTVKFTPPRSNLLATRPAITFSKMPGKLSSVHSGNRSATLSGTSPSKAGKVARTAYCWPKGAAPPPTPMITDVRRRSFSQGMIPSL